MTVLRDADSELGPFRERDTQILTATVQDNNGAPIAGADLVSLTYTLYSEKTLAIINSRSAVNAKPNVSALGVLTLELTPADMAIVDGKVSENHRLLIEWVYASNRRGSYEIRLIVENEQKVP